MMGGPGRFGNMLNQETLKPRNLGDPLARLGGYFGRFWYMLVLAVLFVVIATWTQVTTPELIGQATDCFLVPLGQSAFGQFGSFGASAGSSPAGTSQAEAAASSCWLGTTEPSALSPTRQLIVRAYHFGGYESLD